MDIFFIFLIWAAVTIIDNMSKRKKRRLPPPQNQSPDFEIPSLANSPSVEMPIFIESPRPAEFQPINPPPQTKKIPAQIREAEEEIKPLDLRLTPSNVMNAFLMSEILDKPKALRRRR